MSNVELFFSLQSATPLSNVPSADKLHLLTSGLGADDAGGLGSGLDLDLGFDVFTSGAGSSGGTNTGSSVSAVLVVSDFGLSIVDMIKGTSGSINQLCFDGLEFVT